MNSLVIPNASLRSFPPVLFIMVVVHLLSVAWMAQAAEVGQLSSPLIRDDTRDLFRSDEEFRLYGSDFQLQQFFSDCRVPQTPSMNAIHTQFLYSPQLNAFKIPANIPVGGGLNLFASVPFLQREVVESAGLAHTQGIGDLSLGLGWNGDFGRRLFFQLRGFGKLPTGDASAVYEERPLPLGTGSFDYGATTQAQLRTFDWAYLMAGYNARINGDGETVNGDSEIIKSRRGAENSRIFGVSFIPTRFLSVSGKWSQVRQESNSLIQDGEVSMLNDAQTLSFLIPELAVFVGAHAQLTLQAHLPATSDLSRVISWTHDRNALVDLSVSAFF